MSIAGEIQPMTYGAQEPDWDRLTAMINELASRKGLARQRTAEVAEAEQGKATQRLKGISYRQLGQAIGKSPTIMYGIVDRYHKPSTDTLAALADYARQDPRIDHLAERGTWMRAAGIFRTLRESQPQPLDETERKILATLADMTPDEKERMFQLIETGKKVLRPAQRKGNSR